MERTAVALLIYVVEHGCISARHGRAICTAIRQHTTITHLQHKQDAADESFWKLAPEQHMVELLCAGRVPAGVLHAKAHLLAIDRDLDCIVAAMLFNRFGLLDPAAAGDKAMLQALFERATEPVGHTVECCVRASRSARMLLARYRSIDPAANDNAAFVYFGMHDDASMVRLLLADARVDPCAQHHRVLLSSCQRGNVQVAQALLADARVNPRVGGGAGMLAAGNHDVVNFLRRVGAVGVKRRVVRHVTYPSVRCMHHMHRMLLLHRMDGSTSWYIPLRCSSHCPLPSLWLQGVLTLLHCAVISRHKAMVELLLANGAVVNAQDSVSASSRHCALGCRAGIECAALIPLHASSTPLLWYHRHRRMEGLRCTLLRPRVSRK